MARSSDLARPGGRGAGCRRWMGSAGVADSRAGALRPQWPGARRRGLDRVRSGAGSGRPAAPVPHRDGRRAVRRPVWDRVIGALARAGDLHRQAAGRRPAGRGRPALRRAEAHCSPAILTISSCAVAARSGPSHASTSRPSITHWRRSSTVTRSCFFGCAAGLARS